MHKRPLERIVGYIFVDQLYDLARNAEAVVVILLPGEGDAQLLGAPGCPALDVADERSHGGKRIGEPRADINTKMNMIRHDDPGIKAQTGIAASFTLKGFKGGKPERRENNLIAGNRAEKRLALGNAEGNEENRPARIVIALEATAAFRAG